MQQRSDRGSEVFRIGSQCTVSCLLFFFSSRRRHTRYIGDWSSDVCSSDLIDRGPGCRMFENLGNMRFRDVTAELGLDFHGWGMGVAVGDVDGDGFDDIFIARSEERRVGKECRSRWAATRERRDREGKTWMV